MRKGIMGYAQESLAVSAEQVQIEKLKKENNLLKTQAMSRNRNLATEGFFDFFKNKEPITTHAPVTAEKELTVTERLRKEHKLLRNTATFVDNGTKTLEGNNKIYCTFFPSMKALKTHFSDMLSIVDFVQTTCENTVKAYDLMRKAVEHYAETEDLLALLQEHKKYLKISALPDIAGFSRKVEEIQTKDLFQSLIFIPEVFLSEDKSWVLSAVNVVHKPLKDAQLQQVAAYDFPNISYGIGLDHYGPTPKTTNFTVTCSKNDFVEIHKQLNDACIRTLDLLAKYDHGNNPIEDYISNFTTTIIRKGKAKDKNFNTAGLYRADDNYYRGRYLYVLADLVIMLTIHIDHFNRWAQLYSPESNAV